MSVHMRKDEFLRAMKELTKETGVELQTIMRWQMGLWVRDIMLKIYNDPTASIAQQKKIGENAIHGDLLGKSGHRALFEPLKEDTQWWEYKHTKAASYDVITLKTKAGAVYHADKLHFLPRATLADLHRLHQQNRTKSGRVSTAGDYDLTIGRWRVKNVYTVPQRVLMQYVADVKGRVGRAKASWLHAYEYFVRRVGRVFLPWMPTMWISRHKGAVAGMGVSGDTFNEAAMTGEWSAGSNMDFGIAPQDAITRTWPTRIKDLTGPYAAKRLKGRIEKFSATRKAA